MCLVVFRCCAVSVVDLWTSAAHVSMKYCETRMLASFVQVLFSFHLHYDCAYLTNVYISHVGAAMAVLPYCKFNISAIYLSDITLTYKILSDRLKILFSCSYNLSIFSYYSASAAVKTKTKNAFLVMHEILGNYFLKRPAVIKL